MEIKIVIDAPKGWKRRVLLYVVTPVGLIAAAAMGARAYDTTWIASGQQVSATDLKADLDEAQTRIAALEAFRTQATADGGYSLGATYCGQTSAVSGTAFGAYVGAKALCQVACGNAPAAHMCTGDELTRSTALGHSIPQNSTGGWYSAGSSSAGGGSPINDDCDGWLEGASTFQGAAWVNNPANNQNGPSVNPCNSPAIPILCCD